MKIAIIGAGHVGTGLGHRLAAKGHAIRVAFATTPANLAAAAQAIGGGAQPASVADAVAFAELVIIATPWVVTLEAVKPVPAAAWAGMRVWDCTNPIKPDMSGLSLGTTTSAGEELAKALPGARLVKAIPPFAQMLHSHSMALDAGPPQVFVCGDDAVACSVVAGLVDEIGAVPVMAGPLINARYAEPAGFLLVQLAYGQGLGPRIGMALLRDGQAAHAADPQAPSTSRGGSDE